MPILPGEDGRLFTDLRDVTTALQMIEQAVVTIGTGNEFKENN